MIELVRDIVMDNWATWFPARHRPRRLRFLQSAHNSQALGRILLFIFADRDFAPLLLAKIPLSEHGHAQLYNEHARLKEVRQMLPREVADTIPEPLFLERLAGEPVGIERALSGFPVESHTTAHGRTCLLSKGQLEKALWWLAELHSHTTVNRLTLGDLPAPLASLRALGNWYELSVVEKRLIERLGTLADELAGEVVPLVYQHGDFWSGNILWHRGRVSGVIDWEHAKPGSLPFLDLGLFVQDTSTPLDDELLRPYLERMDISTRLVALFWPVALADMATRECSITNEEPTRTDHYFRRLFSEVAEDIAIRHHS